MHKICPMIFGGPPVKNRGRAIPPSPARRKTKRSSGFPCPFGQAGVSIPGRVSKSWKHDLKTKLL